MRSQIVLVVVAALALAGAWLLFSGSGSVDPTLSHGNAPGADGGAAAATAVAPAAAAPATGEPTSAPVADPQRTRVEAAPAEAAAADVPCTVSGRLVGRSGQPLAGLELTWRSWRTSGDPFGSPLAGEGLRDLAGRLGADDANKTQSGVDGRFRFGIGRGRAGNVRLDPEHHVFAAGEAAFNTTNGDVDLGDLKVLEPARIGGIVVDEHGRPVAGVRVSADAGTFGFGSSSTATSAADGTFAIGALHGGAWSVRTLSDRYLPTIEKVELRDEEQRTDLQLVVKQGQAIAGRVVDDRGLPVADASVGAMRRERTAGVAIERFQSAESTRTDQGGYFTLGGLQDDAVSLRARKEGHKQASAAGVKVGTGDVVLQLDRLGSIAGVLRSGIGKPLAGSRIVAVPAGGPQRFVPGDDGQGPLLLDDNATAVTGDDGTFVVQNVTPGAVTLRATGKTHLPAELGGLTLAPAQELRGVLLTADVGAAVAAHVVDETGAPVEGAEVTVREVPHQGGRMTFGSRTVGRTVRARAGGGGDDDDVQVFGMGPKELGAAETDRAGAATVAGLPTGEVQVTCSHPQLADAVPVSLSLPVQGTVETKLTLRRPGAAQLVVTGPDGTGVAAQYSVRGPLGGDDAVAATRTGTAAADGRAVVDRLAPGDYTAELRLAPAAQHMGGGMSFVIGGSERPLAGTEVRFRVDAGATVEVPMQMPQLTLVHGTVRGIDGPAAGVTVKLLAAEDPAGGVEIPGLMGEGQSAVTDQDGAWSIADVVPGRYRLSWGKPEQLARAHDTLDVPAGQVDLQRDLELRFGRLRVQVASADDGEPIEGAEVELVEAGVGGPAPQRRQVMMISLSANDGGGADQTSMTLGQARASTDVDGIAVIDMVPPGRYTVRVTHSRHSQKDVPDVVVAEQAETDAGRVELAAAGRVRGRVVAADGSGVPMALVVCQSVAGGEPQRQPAMGGAFTFGGLAVGRYELHAEAMGPGGSSAGPPVVVQVAAGKTVSDVELKLPPD